MWKTGQHIHTGQGKQMDCCRDDEADQSDESECQAHDVWDAVPHEKGES
jgi:hypothetical protein